MKNGIDDFHGSGFLLTIATRSNLLPRVALFPIDYYSGSDILLLGFSFRQHLSQGNKKTQKMNSKKLINHIPFLLYSISLLATNRHIKASSSLWTRKPDLLRRSVILMFAFPWARK